MTPPKPDRDGLFKPEDLTPATRSAGIYVIQRKGGSECYIGSAVNLASRWAVHRSNLRNGKHHSRHMQRVHDKHGADVLSFAILEPVSDRGHLLAREQAWLDMFRPAYNAAKIAGNCLGVRHSDETNAANSARQKGKKKSPESIASRARALTGRKRSDETRARISAANKGRKCAPLTPEQRAAHTAALTGQKRTPEQRERMSAAQNARYAAARAKVEAV